MRKLFNAACSGLLVAGCLIPAIDASAAQGSSSITIAPMRIVTIDGDREKFRAHHWFSDEYGGGVKDFSTTATFADGTVLDASGHAMISDNSYSTDLSLVRDDLGFIKFDFDEFRKWYDGTGGTFNLFTTLGAPETDKELHLDIGQFTFETGLTLEDLPELGFVYQRRYKDGTKSHLTWGEAEEAFGTRNITPSWTEMDEIVDNFELSAKDELGGFDVGLTQTLQWVHTELLHVEQDRATTSGSGDTKDRFQDQSPESRTLATTLTSQRRFGEGKGYFSSAYHFSRMDSREYETIIETDGLGTATNFAAPKSVRNARADSDVNTHKWVGNISWDLLENLNLITKVKSEIATREGVSFYPQDTTSGAPDGVIDIREDGNTDSKLKRWGESVGLRFTGIPRTALYTELELEQARVLLREDLFEALVPTSTASWSRETVTNVRRGVWTLGGRYSPVRMMDMTAHVRHRRNNNDYDDQRETTSSSSSRSAFVDMQNIHTNEFATRVTLKPCRWFRSSARYQMLDQDFSHRFDNAGEMSKTSTTAHIQTYDMTVQPLDSLMLTGSFSRTTQATVTPASVESAFIIPTFNSDVNTWMLSGSYAPSSDVSLHSTLYYAHADNFDDFSATSLPYGADNDRLDLITGIDLALKDGISVGAEYGYYTYNANGQAETGEYDAHLVSFDVTAKF